MIYDVAIIGGGPVGIAAIRTLAPKGKSIILFEGNKLGGTCLNEGCMPTKALLHSAHVFEALNEANKAGVEIGGAAKANYNIINQRKNQIIQALGMGATQGLEASGANIVYEMAQIDGENEDGTIRIKAGNQFYNAKDVILGAGSTSAIPPIKGIETAEYITSREILELTEAPKSLTVIGGGVLGLEFASLFAILGTKVDLVEMSPEILPTMDAEYAAIVRQQYEGKGIRFHLGAKAEQVNGKEIIISKNGVQTTLSNELLLMAVGRKPATDKLNLSSLNIETNRNAIVVDAQMKTSHPHVYACGDVIGGSMLAHTAMHEARVAAHTIMGISDSINYDSIPAVVYTNPEIASVGATEATLKNKGIAYNISNAAFAQAGRYVLENDFQTPGAVKVLTDKESGKIVGIHLIGNPASELIAIGTMAVAEGYTIAKMQQFVFPHPTVAAVFQNLA